MYATRIRNTLLIKRGALVTRLRVQRRRVKQWRT